MDELPGDEVISILQQQEQNAISSVYGALGQSPDDAARARQLSKSSGVNEDVVYNRLKDFDDQYKAKLTSEILKRDPALIDYANVTPLNAKISSDDWGNMSEVSQRTKEFYDSAGPVLGRFLNTVPAFGQAVGEFIGSIPKTGSIISAEFAAERLRALIQPEPLPPDLETSSPFEVAAYRLRKAGYHPTPVVKAEQETFLKAEVAQPIKDRPLFALGEAIDQGVKSILPTNPEYKDEWLAQKIPAGLGSAVGFLVSALLLKGVGAGTTGPLLGLGAASSGTEQFEDALKHGASLEDAFKAFNLGAVVGTSEAAPMALLLNRLDKSTGGGVKKMIAGALVQGTEEAIQEAFQSIAGNLIASKIVSYDPERGTFTGTAEASGLGFTVGALMSTIGHLVMGRRARGSQRNIGDDVKDKTEEVLNKAMPWLEQGQDPPIGVDPILDQVLIPQTEQDVAKLREALNAAAQSLTRERSAEALATAAEMHGNGTVIISGDAVARLYAGKPIAPDDGILGWVEDLSQQMALVSIYGGDVQIPASQWLANMDPALSTALEPDMKTRPDGLSATEAIEYSAWEQAVSQMKSQGPKPIAPTVVDGITDAAAIKPLVETGPTGHKLVRSDPVLSPEQLAGEKSIHYGILGPDGVPIGEALVGIDGKKIAIDDIRSFEGENTIGYSAMRDLLKQLQAEFPQAEGYAGIRVSGAREKAGTTGTVTYKFSAVEGVEQAAQDASERGWEFNIAGTTGRFVPTSMMTRAERQLTKKIDQLIERLGGKGRIRVRYADNLKPEDGGVLRGTIFTYDENTPLIILALDPKQLPSTARHEVIHFLREHNIITSEEWVTLRQAAIDGKWIERHEIDKIEAYDQTDMELLLEEAIASEFGQWGASRAKAIELGAKYTKTFEKIAEFFKGIREMLTEIYGHTPEVSELFEKIESGEIGRREGGLSRTTGKPAQRMSQGPAQPELPQVGTTRVEDRTPFVGRERFNLTARQYDLYMAHIDRMQDERAKAKLEKVAKEVRKRETEIWKTNRDIMRQEVAAGVKDRPDIKINADLTNGLPSGAKLTISSEGLTKEQIAALPKKFVTKKGSDPQVLAESYHFDTKDDMVNAIVALRQEIDKSGGREKVYVERIIDVQTDSAMEAKYGKLDVNIIDEAMQQVFSESQINVLAEQTYLLATQAGLEYSIKHDRLRDDMLEDFDQTTVGSLNKRKLLQTSGRQGRNLETFRLQEDWGKAFRMQQNQYYTALLIERTIEVEETQAKHGRLVKRLSVREPTGLAGEYTHFIHQLLQATGEYTRRGEGDIEHNIAQGFHNTLDSFIEQKLSDQHVLDVADWIRKGEIKPVDQMTLKEYDEYTRAIRSMYNAGRLEESVFVDGQRRDYLDWRREVLINIKSLPFRSREKQERLLEWFYKADSYLTRPEEIIKDLDLRRELGPLYKALIVPMMNSKHTEYEMQEKLRAKLTEMTGAGKAWRKTLDDVIPNDFFLDKHGNPFKLTREFMINIMLNFGNPSNVKKFTEGWAGKEGAKDLEAGLKVMFATHATAEDWKFVKDIGEIFEGWRKMADTVYYNLSGTTPKWLDIPEGGWYFPIIEDSFWSDIHPSSVSPFQRNYLSFVTADHYTHERDGSARPVEFERTIEMLAGRMQQQIHDIAFRESVLQAAKIVNDPKIMAAIKEHYGETYASKLPSWVSDVANHYNVDEIAHKDVYKALARTRMNLAVFALGFNPNIVASPDIGKFNPAVLARFMKNPIANMEMVWATSKEIPHTHRNVDRDYAERLQELFHKNKMQKFEQEAAKLAFWAVVKGTQGFRYLTFYGEYIDAYPKRLAEAKALGLEDNEAQARASAEAAVLGDAEVRLRHGATGIVDLPPVMRTNEGLKYLTIFGSFQNAMYNSFRHVKGSVERTGSKFLEGDFKGSAKEFSDLMGTMYAAWIIPMVFGFLVFNEYDKEDSWFKIIAKTGAMEQLARLPGIRDAAKYALQKQEMRVPYESLFISAANLANDFAQTLGDDRDPKKMTKHALETIGLVRGLPIGSMTRSFQYWLDVEQGREFPNSTLEYANGVIRGKGRSKGKKWRWTDEFME